MFRIFTFVVCYRNIIKRSFKKGRGLNIHKAKTNCKEILANRNVNKSKSSIVPDKNHSDSTCIELPEAFIAQKTNKKALKEYCGKTKSRDKVREENILVEVKSE